MLDALIPASECALKGGSLSEICEAADKGVDDTKLMSALAGRSSYLKKSETDGHSDPGAVAMALILHIIAKHSS